MCYIACKDWKIRWSFLSETARVLGVHLYIRNILEHHFTVRIHSIYIHSPVLLLLAQVRRLWRQLQPNSLTRLCVVLLMPWPQPQSIACEVHPNSWINVCLTILIRLRFSRLVVHLFLPHFFLPLNFLLTCLDTALCEQLIWQWMFVAYPPCEGCQWLSSEQLSDPQSSPWLCSLVNQTERPFWRLRKHLQVFWVD